MVELLESTLIGNHKQHILAGLPTLLDAQVGWQAQERSIRSLYEFFDQTNLVPELIKAWKAYIEDHGNQTFASVRQEGTLKM